MHASQQDCACPAIDYMSFVDGHSALQQIRSHLRARLEIELRSRTPRLYHVSICLGIVEQALTRKTRTPSEDTFPVSLTTPLTAVMVESIP